MMMMTCQNFEKWYKIKIPFDPWYDYNKLMEAIMLFFKQTWVLRVHNKPKNLLEPYILLTTDEESEKGLARIIK